ncbi:MAG TPA: DHHA1 domain-containing protein [Azonexus sp.]
MTATTRTTVIYHADCIDGFGAAYAAWRRFGDNARYRPLHHGETVAAAELAGDDVYILDFSFAPAELEAMATNTRSLTQIDHHVSARNAWSDRLTTEADGAQTYRHPALPLQIVFDLDKSGARLAWEHFSPGQPLPLLLQHIEDQDLWRFVLPETSRLCRALRLQPFDFAIWHELVEQTASNDTARYRQLLSDGGAIESFFRIEVDRLAASRLRQPARLRGEPVDALQALRHGQATVTDGESTWLAVTGLAVNASTLFSSELGHRLAQQSGSFGLTWQLAADGEVKASLRSEGEFDVAAIAARYGGGGHRNAAGFRLPLARFATEVLGLAADQVST